MKQLLLFIWQLPQNIVGLLLRIILPFINKNIYLLNSTSDLEIVAININTSFTLGRYMFLGNKAGSIEIENQLYNHKQSIKWGPFYVLYAIIGYILEH